MIAASSQTILLVDGYNVIGCWPELRETRDRDGFDMARHDLVEAIANYSAFEGLDARVVFDSQHAQTPAKQEKVTANLSIHYTKFGETADTYIEKQCASLCRDEKRRTIVATSDRDQQLTVLGYGAEWMSALEFARTMRAAEGHRRRQQRSKKKSTRRLLGNSLDPAARQRLIQMLSNKHL